MSTNLIVKYQRVADLKPYPNNSRTHPKAQIRQLAESIDRLGFNTPVIVDKNNTIMAGHARIEAAKLLGLVEVPTISLDHLTDAQIKAYIIADNRIAEKGGWDRDILATEFSDLIDMDFDFGLDVTGFSFPEIDLMLHDKDDQDPDEGDEVPEPKENVVTRLGDLWNLGEHRLLCGNSLEDESYALLMGEEKAQAIFTDPPYNVKIDGHVGGLGKVHHEEFAMASGEMSQQQFIDFLTRSCRLMVHHAQDGAMAFICMDWRHMEELCLAGKAAGAEMKNLCVWSKDNGGMGTLYRSRHELVFVFKFGAGEYINNVKLGKYGRNRTNVWNYRGVNSLRKGRSEDLAMHPTVKPLRMVSDALQDVSHRGGLVLDPFGGSGTTLIAAEKTGRKARLIELEPRYVDVTIRRWQELTGKAAMNTVTGQNFNQQSIEAEDDGR